ncbi:hypothetical protein Pint_22463 [Pistacia integerrima]|uniref:Uncharacterized protein n=1 Tax=Pistacia integerrima TaxID=434235 RepID=A0ACC0YN51_9ROSI|nr:hypothetical protein Pint_22463 [Pistacia integerrima]
MVGCKLIIKKKKTGGGDWLSTLLHCEFFSSCIEHQQLRKNEKNVFCIDCNLDFCRHCESAHCLHRRLQICKYVYQDVVRLQDMQKHLDCSKIQTYKINGEKAVHLSPRPQLKDAKPSTKSKTGASCEACGRYIQDLPNRFCSIACKVYVVSVKPKDQSHKIITFPIQECNDLSWKNNYNSENSSSGKESSLSFTDPSDVSQAAWRNSTLKPRKQLHKRKGIPHRAPLC